MMEESLTVLHFSCNKIQSEDTDCDSSRDKFLNVSMREVQDQHGRYKSMNTGPSVKLNITQLVTPLFKDNG